MVPSCCACREVLFDAHDAEEAFQATFLILARKAGTIHKRDALASWLFGVARRVAGRAKARRKRRAAHERAVGSIPEAQSPPSDQPREAIPEIREEVDRLPERYRAPIVLCYWNGLTHQQAAIKLCVPASTVRVRLMRARLRLRDRLIRRGLAPAALVGLSAGHARSAIPAHLVDETTRAATRIAAGRAAGARAPVAALVEGVIRAMFIAKLKLAAVALAVLLLASIMMISSLAGSAPSRQARAIAPKSPVTAVPPAKAPEAASDGPELTVETVRRSRWKKTTNQFATVVAAQSIKLYSKISGYLSSLKVDIGSRVKAGELLARISNPELTVAVDKARAEVDRARARVNKAKAAMHVSQAATSTEQARVQAASSELKESEASVQAQKKTLDRMQDLARRGDVEQRIAEEEAGKYQSTVAALATARSQLLVARAEELETRAKLEEAEANLVEAESDVRIAEAGLRHAQMMGNYASVTAPFDGVVTLCDYRVGDYVRLPDAANSSPILTLVQTQTMRVVVHVPENDAPYLEVGSHVRFVIGSLGARGVFEGKIARTGYAQNLADRTVRAEIDLSNADGRLRPGQAGRVTIDLATRENVLTILSAAITERGTEGLAACYRVVAGRAVQTPIKIGGDNGTRAEVIEGLNEGDIVISQPAAGMKDGQPVHIRPE